MGRRNQGLYFEKHMKIIQRIKNLIHFLQSLPYEKRVYLLQISLIVVVLIGFLVWMSVFKSEVSNNKVALEEKKDVTPSKLDIFKKGIYLSYQDVLLPALKKASEVFISLFSFSVQIVIRVFNFTSHLAQQILVQYKAYAQLIYQVFF